MNSSTKNPLSVAASETALEPSIQEMLVSRFTPFLEQTTEWRERAETLIVTDISQVREMKMAREARLALREIRINADKLRKELKEDSLRYGRAVQGVYNVIETNIIPIEKHLEAQEKFKEIYEMQQREALRIEREQLVFDVRQYMFANVNLGEITEEDFQRLWTGAKLQADAAQQAALKAESDRIAKEQAEAQERERLRVENERLKEEAFNREIERRTELDRLEAEQRKANMEALRIRKEADAKAAAERAELERLQSELKAKKDAEIKAESERLRAEIKAKAEAEKNAKAPIKKQLSAWINSFSIPEVNIANNKTILIQQKFEAFKNWAKNEIESI